MTALWRDRASSLALLIVLLVVWQLLCIGLDLPSFVLPSPLEVAGWLVRGFSRSPFDPAGMLYHLAVTAAEALAGFVIGCVTGIGCGFALAHWARAERIFYPYIQAFNALPKIALAPLLVVWVGYGLEAKVVMAAILVFFPMLVNSMAGYHAIEPDRIDMARVCGATQTQIFNKIVIPSAMPFIFAGLHMAVVIALLGAIVGEFVGATAGLGMLLLQYNNNIQVGGVFAVLVVLGALGFVLNLVMQAMERRYCFWARRAKNFG